MTNAIDSWEYTFEVQLSWAPAGGYLRAPYYRETWDAAWKEAETYAKFAARNGQPIAVRVIRIDRATGKQIHDNYDTITYP